MKYAEDISGNPKKWGESIGILVEKGLLSRNEKGFWGDQFWGRHQLDTKRIYWRDATEKQRNKGKT